MATLLPGRQSLAADLSAVTAGLCFFEDASSHWEWQLEEYAWHSSKKWLRSR